MINHALPVGVTLPEWHGNNFDHELSPNVDFQISNNGTCQSEPDEKRAGQAKEDQVGEGAGHTWPNK